MKKKSRWLVLLLVLVATGAVSVFYISKNEKDKQHPVERYQEKQEEQGGKGEGDSSGESVEQNKDDMADTASSHSFTQGNILYEFLSCEVIEDTEIEKQTKYPVEYFKNAEMADSNYQTTVYDWEAMVDEEPELEGIFSACFDYTEDEYQEIYDKHRDVIDNNTYEGHPKTRYFFVNMRITNQRDRMVELAVSDMRIVVSTADKKVGVAREGICYFSSPQNIQGDDRVHRFYWYNMQPEETLTCTVGFAVREDWIYPSEQYVYAGYISPDMGCEWINPVLSKTVVPLYDLPQPEK